MIVWEFEVKAGREEEFLAAYGPEGSWARLFGEADGFLGVELAQSVKDPNRFFTIDTWDSKEAFQAFLAGRAASYEALDRELAGLTERERRIGAFSAGV